MVEQRLLDDTARLRAALTSIANEVEALPDALVRNINANVTWAVNVVLGAVPNVMAFRERAAKLPEFGIACFDKLETYALALFQAQAVALAAATPPGGLAELVDRAMTRRRELLDDIKPLSNRHLLDLSLLANLHGGNGHRELALDLEIIAEVLRNAWPTIKDSTPIQESELSEVEILAQSLLVALARQDGDDPKIDEAQRVLRRVFTLFAQAYEEVGRAISFLRPGEDVSTIVPSIYVGARPAKKGDASTPSPSPSPSPSPAPSPAPAPPTAGSVARSAGGARLPTATATAAGAVAAPVGDPNSSPLES